MGGRGRHGRRSSGAAGQAGAKPGLRSGQRASERAAGWGRRGHADRSSYVKHFRSKKHILGSDMQPVLQDLLFFLFWRERRSTANKSSPFVIRTCVCSKSTSRRDVHMFPCREPPKTFSVVFKYLGEAVSLATTINHISRRTPWNGESHQTHTLNLPIPS